MWKTRRTPALNAVLVAGCLVLTATACGGGDPKPPGATGGGKGLKIGGLSIAAPTGWKVRPTESPDSFRVVTGGDCPTAEDQQSGCRGFQLLGQSHIKPDEDEGLPIEPYRTDEPHAAQFVQDEGHDCPADPRLRSGDRSLGARLVAQGKAVVGGRQAQYLEWDIPCYTRGPHVGEPDKKSAVSYVERDWLVTGSQVLIVDEWSTPKLRELLEHATWG